MSQFMPDTDIQVGGFRKNPDQILRVTVNNYKGMRLLDIRLYYQKEGEWLPGKSGFSLRLEQYPDLMNILDQIPEILIDHGLEPPTSASPMSNAGNRIGEVR